MAATDKPYRNQYQLDIVFGVTCLLLLLSVGWMMYDDHYRAFKPIQRNFRDVEDALYIQQMAEKFPQDRLKDIETAQKEAKEARQLIATEKKKIGEKVGGDPNVWLDKQKLEKARLEATYQDRKATYDSEVSLYNIAIDERDEASDPAHKKKLSSEVEEKKKNLDKLEKELQETQHKLTENEKATADALAGEKKAEDELAGIQDQLRKMTNDFDRLAKLAAQKRWKAGDWFRALPIIDGFASPYKIQQFTLNDLTIEYGSFKDVPRYDRCTTCHLAIDRGTFDKAALRDLDLANRAKAQDKDPAEMRKQLDERYDKAVAFLQTRASNDESLGFNPDDLPSHYEWPVGMVAIVLLVLTIGAAGGLGYWLGSPGAGVGIGIVGCLITAVTAGVLAGLSPRVPDDVPNLKLTASQVNQYCAHPRLDLFVDSNSPHPAEKFGCTICHAGQGSATEFSLAAHTPNNPVQRKDWEKADDWEPTHDWEFPMLPARFVESGCVKCHHQMTDLIRQGSKEEAPKVLRGYKLVKDFGCFGCHEISGLKSGKEIGPDLRLEPTPALEHLSPEEQAKILSDPGNPPGTMRKVGPALRRISEKTTESWVRKWVNSPRGFRPDTRMPHFYNLSTSNPDVLPDDQKSFPATEISSIAYYLVTESQAYLNGTDRFRRYNLERLKELEDLAHRGLLSDKQTKELVEVRRRLDQWKVPTPVAVQMVDTAGRPIPADQIPPPGNDKDRQEGRRLFTERGCLACHSHAGTEPGVGGDAHFGPNLSRLAGKIGLNGLTGRRWLIQWIMNPNVSHPRTRMPITLTEMTPTEAVKAASQIADWLLTQSEELKDPEYQEWNKTEIAAPTHDELVSLARVYLKKAPAVDQLKVDEILQEGFTNIPQEAPLMAGDADERVLQGPMTEDKLKYYIGKKAVGRMGCFACHDIPGFEYAKPIGTPLNDWGKKDPARLAFEDINAFVKDTYDIVELRNDPNDKAKPAQDWSKAVAEGKKPYEKFFADALFHQKREGFLHQKLEAPRSYDYHRDLKWDDRLRMPQFRFATTIRREKDESDEEFSARASMEEAEAREAVMTFILGLTAENIAGRYLNNPDPDHLAEVKGRQVLEKFNCSGCHLVRSGVYEFKLADGDGGSRALLEKAYRNVPKDKFATDHIFGNDNAWAASQPLNADRLTVHGANPRPKSTNGETTLQVRLTDAAQFLSPERDKGETLIAYGAKGKAPLDGYRETLVLPAANDIFIDPNTLVGMPAPPFGGTFADLMWPYLVKKDIDKYKNEDGARGALPPPLVREGQKVQTEWLYNFLRNPTPIRPITILRMPKFNMSDEDARALVNYFAAADKVGNPGIGLTYPYSAVRERDDVYWSEQAQRYWLRSGQSQGLQARIKKLQDEAIPAAKKTADEAKEEASKKQAQGLVSNLEAKLKTLQDLTGKPSEAAASLYWTDAYSLLATKGRSACLQCHSVGAVPASEQQGPPLELAAARLRPDWTEHWIANPKRLITYDTAMPQNFPNGQPDFQELFPGGSLEQIQAARDVLMNLHKVADVPVNQSYRAATSGGK